MDYTRFFNPVSANRQAAPLRELHTLLERADPDTIFLAGGIPSNKMFPFESITVKLKDSSQGNISLEGNLLDTSLNYLSSNGYTPLRNKLKELLTRVHWLQPDFWETRDIMITTGGQEGLCKVIEMCMMPGDPVIFPEPTYAGALEIARPYSPKFIAVPLDDFGPCPQKLRKALEAFGTPEEIRSRRTGVPKIMYINPTGSNPSGGNVSTQRKHELYKLACEYDLLILEDDPYYYVHFQTTDPVSFIAMDTENRVVRCDSCSKIISSGMRIGFVTGPTAIIDRLNLHMQICDSHPSALSQVIIDELLGLWGPDRLQKHVREVQMFYKKQRDVALISAKKYLTGLAEWEVPQGGMFLWIRVLGIDDATDVAGAIGVEYGVVLLAGNVFMTDDKAPCPYVRASYSNATPQQIDMGFKRFAMIIRSEQAKRTKSIQNGTNTTKM